SELRRPLSPLVQDLEVLLGDVTPLVTLRKLSELVPVESDLTIELVEVDRAKVVLPAVAHAGHLEKVVDQPIQLAEVVAQEIDGERGVLGRELLNARLQIAKHENPRLSLGGERCELLGLLLQLGVALVLVPELVEPSATEHRRIGR